MHGPINIRFEIYVFAQHFRSLDLVFLYRFLPRKFKNRYYFAFRKAFPFMHERLLVLCCDLSTIPRHFRSSAGSLEGFKISPTSACIKQWSDLISSYFATARRFFNPQGTNWLTECFYRWGQRSSGPLLSELVVIPNRTFCENISAQSSKVSNFGENLLGVEWQRTALFLNRRAATRYRALTSIIPGRERFSWNLSFSFSKQFSWINVL